MRLAPIKVYSQGKVLDLMQTYNEFKDSFGEAWRSETDRREALVQSIQENQDNQDEDMEAGEGKPSETAKELPEKVNKELKDILHDDWRPARKSKKKGQKGNSTAEERRGISEFQQEARRIQCACPPQRAYSPQSGRGVPF